MIEDFRRFVCWLVGHDEDACYGDQATLCWCRRCARIVDRTTGPRGTSSWW